MLLLASFPRLYMGAIVPVAILLPLATAVYRYRHLHTGMKVFGAYLLLNGCCNLAAALLAWNGITNLALLHIYTPLELAMVLLYYRCVINDERMAKYIYIIIAFFSVLCLVNSFFLQSLHRYNSYARPLSGIIIMVYGLYYFKTALDNDTGSYEQTKIYLWINAGLLIYFGGSFFLFAYANLIPDRFMNTLMWMIHATLVLIMYLLSARGLAYAKHE